VRRAPERVKGLMKAAARRARERVAPRTPQQPRDAPAGRPRPLPAPAGGRGRLLQPSRAPRPRRANRRPHLAPAARPAPPRRAGLKKFLKKNATGETLAVLDAKLGSLIKDKLDIPCVYSGAVQELARGVRAQLSGLIRCDGAVAAVAATAVAAAEAAAAAAATARRPVHVCAMARAGADQSRGWDLTRAPPMLLPVIAAAWRART
jgi:hypothetical protein